MLLLLMLQLAHVATKGLSFSASNHNLLDHRDAGAKLATMMTYDWRKRSGQGLRRRPALSRLQGHPSPDPLPTSGSIPAKQISCVVVFTASGPMMHSRGLPNKFLWALPWTHIPDVTFGDSYNIGGE